MTSELFSNCFMSITFVKLITLRYFWKVNSIPCFCFLLYIVSSFPCSSVGKESACNAGDLGLIPGLGGSSGEGNGNPLQYSCLENPLDRGAWQDYSPWVSKSWT